MWWGVVKATYQPLYHRKRDMVPIVEEAWWASGPVCTDTENLADTDIRTSDRLACGETLY
jgi:hypothetical protein